MAIAVSPEAVSQSIVALIRASYEYSDGSHRYTLRGAPTELTCELTDEWYTAINASLANAIAQGDTGIATARLYEVLISEESRFGISRLFRDSSVIELTDIENGLSYRVGPPSDEFLAFFLARLAAIAPPAALRSAMVGFRLRKLLDQDEPPTDVMELVRAAVPRLLTCRVTSQANRAAADLSGHANALLFQLTYNLNVALVEMRSLDEFIRSGRLASMRRGRAADIEPPRRVYIQDLTYHYQLGVSSESPVLEFLSFYHVAEHFFEAVFHDDLIEAIRERLTRPDFSTKRKKDVQALIREINKRQRVRDDSITFSEQEALRLTLSKYVPLENLTAKLSAYDKTALPHFEASVVSFCDGDEVPFSTNEPRDVFASLARRVYRTRNAIVHSKDGEKSRFVPFEHDDELAKEVPLIRFIAEEIIIATSARL